MNQVTDYQIQLKPSEMLKLRWLRMEAIHDLQCKESDFIMDLANRYLKGESPTFSGEEINSLNQLYKKVRLRTQTADGANVPQPKGF